MSLPPAVEDISGAEELFDWFGYWPDFHDAEVLKFHIELGAESSLLLHAWEMTNTITPEGFYELRKHVVVEFVLGEVTNLNLQDLWEHSILLSLVISKTAAGFLLELSSAYGLCGIIAAQNISLRLKPGKPSKTC